DHHRVEILSVDRDRLKRVLRRFAVVAACPDYIASWRHVRNRESAVKLNARTEVCADPCAGRMLRGEIDGAAGGRSTIRIHDVSGNPRGADEQQVEIDIDDFLAQS